jgi:glutamate dehydrogenase/leucine dehydrogenase
VAFIEIDVDGYEQVVRCEEPSLGLTAIIAIHSTVLGPALGGARFYPFASEQDALVDVLRLARGMTYKSAVAGNDLGGGKSVAIVDGDHKTPDVLRAFGRFVDDLGGRYITAADVGTNTEDMTVIRSSTEHVGGLPIEMGGSGDPSPSTALGVLHAMRAAVGHRFGAPDLAGRHVVVAGVGKVGGTLVADLVESGAAVTVADVNLDAVDALRNKYEIDIVDPERAHVVECDVYAPCALGGALSPTTIPELRCSIVVGAANNQLATPECADLLDARSILYVPDYLANAGGVINIAEERGGYDAARARARVEAIYDRTLDVLETAASEGLEPVMAAQAIADRRLAAAR